MQPVDTSSTVSYSIYKRNRRGVYQSKNLDTMSVYPQQSRPLKEYTRHLSTIGENFSKIAIKLMNFLSVISNFHLIKTERTYDEFEC